MYRLEKSYGKLTYDEWFQKQPRDLKYTERDTAYAEQNVWTVNSFCELAECVAFLGAMNKRLALFFRGQTHDRNPLPVMFRDEWTCFGTNTRLLLRPFREYYWNKLQQVGQWVYQECDTPDLGLPRWRSLRDIREVQWAIIQHYGLWPTPLIDITSSLRIAASFAMNFTKGSKSDVKEGFVLTVGMPPSTGSITFDIDQQLCLARLYSACPPIAKRAHYQDAFLVGRFPINSTGDIGLEEKSQLNRRLIAKFRLVDDGSFWDEDFPILRETAVYLKEDRLLQRFFDVFGPGKKHSLEDLAQRAQP